MKRFVFVIGLSLFVIFCKSLLANLILMSSVKIIYGKYLDRGKAHRSRGKDN